VDAHPKSGIHLLRNILMHFNRETVGQRLLFYDDFSETLRQQKASRIHWGHLPYSTFVSGVPGLGNVQTILLRRHPPPMAVALARAFFDVNSGRPDHLAMRETHSFEAIVAAVVNGYEAAGLSFSPLISSLGEFCLSWRDNARFVLRFEQLTALLKQDDAGL